MDPGGNRVYAHGNTNTCMDYGEDEVCWSTAGVFFLFVCVCYYLISLLFFSQSIKEGETEEEEGEGGRALQECQYDWRERSVCSLRVQQQKLSGRVVPCAFT